MSNALHILFLSTEDVLRMHDMVIAELGGRKGVHNQDLLESAVNQPFMILSYGTDVEQEISYLAATYFFHIIKNHPFIDGNKRTGLLAALTFLAKNNYELHSAHEALQDELYDLAVHTAASQATKEEIAAFFKNNFIYRY